MTAAMVALQQLMPNVSQAPLPPEQIIENVAEAAGAGDALKSMPEPAQKATTLAAHFGYGATAGVGYIPVAGKSGLPAAAEGALYGLAVWGGSYLGIIPATGIYHAATEEPKARNVLMIAAHVVWGAALGVIYQQLTKRRIEDS